MAVKLKCAINNIIISVHTIIEHKLLYIHVAVESMAVKCVIERVLHVLWYVLWYAGVW